MEKAKNSVDGESINILRIEDNPGDVRLVREMLAEKVGRLFDVQSVDRLATGLAHLAAGGICRVTGSGTVGQPGSRYVRQVRAHAPKVQPRLA